MKLLDWVPLEKLDWCGLSRNPGAIHLLEKNPEKISWKHLSSNPNAIHLLEANPDKSLFLYITSPVPLSGSAFIKTYPCPRAQLSQKSTENL